jgi:TPR repeat protein
MKRWFLIAALISVIPCAVEAQDHPTPINCADVVIRAGAPIYFSSDGSGLPPLGSPSNFTLPQEAHAFVLFADSLRYYGHFRGSAGPVIQVVNREGQTINESPLSGWAKADSTTCDSNPTTAATGTSFSSALMTEGIQKYELMRDKEGALRLFQPFADQGVAPAQYWLGVIYARGDSMSGADKDYSKAAFWFRKAAEQGNTDAAYELGKLYEDGHGVSVDYREAMNWYLKASKDAITTNGLDADVRIGRLYENGMGVKIDPIRALSWYDKASAGGYEPGRTAADALRGSVFMSRWIAEKKAEWNAMTPAQRCRASCAPNGNGLGPVAAYFAYGGGVLGHMAADSEHAKTENDIKACYARCN